MKSNFRDLLAWQKAMDLVDEIYRTVATFPRHERFGLSAQLLRAAIRVPSDIAEGSGRGIYSISDTSCAMRADQGTNSRRRFSSRSGRVIYPRSASRS